MEVKGISYVLSTKGNICRGRRKHRSGEFNKMYFLVMKYLCISILECVKRTTLNVNVVYFLYFNINMPFSVICTSRRHSRCFY